MRAGLALALIAGVASARAQSIGVTATFTGTQPSSEAGVLVVKPLATQATPSPTAIVFGTVPVATSTPPQLTATFTVSGYSGSFTPTAVVHYGYDYSLGAVNCTGGAPPETCTVPVTFKPTLPGGRRDALFLMNGTTRLGTVLIYGVGQAPMALSQPGVSTVLYASPSLYLYGSAVDENGTVFIRQGNNIASVTKAGVATVLPIVVTGAPVGIAIDGAGVLYIADSSFGSSLVTYDTVQGIQGTLPVGSTITYHIGVAVGNAGNVYTIDESSNVIYKIKPDGSFVQTPVSPIFTQPTQLAVDSDEDVFIGGYKINELTVSGTQTNINSAGSATDGIAVDAAKSVYATRYTAVNGVAELAATNYSTSQASLDSGAPLGLSLGSDGTLYVGNYNNLEKVDRGQGGLDFGQQFPGNTYQNATASTYNGGNQPLVFSNVTLTGSGYSFGAVSGTACATAVSLPPGAICSLSIGFTPTHPGTYSGSLTVTTNSLNSTTTTQTTALTGVEYGAFFAATPSPLNFPNEAINTASTPVIETLTNQGNSFSGTLTNATSSDPAFTIDRSTCVGAIAVGSTCPISITFTPTVIKAYTATITLTYVSSGVVATLTNTITVNGSGIAAPTPQAVPTPTSITFPNQIANTSSSFQTLTLSNPGNASLNISGISVTGTGASSFAQTNTCGSSVAANGSCTISVTFTPSGIASYSAAVSVADNASGSPQTISLSGAGIAAPAPVVALAPASLAFANTTVGVTTAAQTLTLSNTGNAVLNITSIAMTGTNPTAFATGGTCGATLAAGASCNITVTFTPTAASALSGTVTVTDNATGSPHKSTVSGTGVVLPVPQAVLSPTTLTFASTTQGVTTAAQIITLSNPGTGALSITGISIGGTNASSFATTNNCGASLAVAASCSISVTFTPTTTGSLTASVSVADNATGTPQSATLAGTGTAPDFGLTVSGSTQTLSSSGGSVQYTISASGSNGAYSSPITFVVTGAPAGTTAVFAPPSITPGSGAATTTLTITVSQSASMAFPMGPLRPGNGFDTSLLPVSLAGVLCCFIGRRRMRLLTSRSRLLVTAIVFLGLGILAGCGGGFRPTGVIQPGTYTLTVTGTGSAGQHSTNLTLVVQ